MSIDPDAGRPTVLTTPAAPQAEPDIEQFDPPTVDPATVFEQSELRRRLKEAGKLVDGQAAHHIVPGGGPMNGGRDARRSQQLLEELEIERNGVDNGIALSPEFHSRLHTKGYYEYVERQLQRLMSKEEVTDRLQAIGRHLQEADRAYQQTGRLPNWSE